MNRAAISATAVLGLGTLLAGCGGGDLSCDSNATKDLVIQIVKKAHPPESMLFAGDYFEKQRATEVEAASQKSAEGAKSCQKEAHSAWMSYFRTNFSSLPNSYDNDACRAKFRETADTSVCFTPNRQCDKEAGRVGLTDPERYGPAREHCDAILRDCMQNVNKKQREERECETEFESLRQKADTCANDRKNAAFSAIRKEIDDATTAAYAAAAYVVDTIRLTAKNETTGRLTCAAIVHATLPDNIVSSSLDVTYDVDRTTDGQLFVTVSE